MKDDRPTDTELARFPLARDYGWDEWRAARRPVKVRVRDVLVPSHAEILDVLELVVVARKYRHK
jgi:hypothetical protein